MIKKLKEVDEDAIRDMIKGDIPRRNITVGNQPPPEEPEAKHEAEHEEESGAAAPTELTALPVGEAARPRRRKEPKDYASTFLRKREPVQKRQTYISAAHFTKITEILAVVASDVSVPVFLDNLIEHHLEQNRDEINALYSDKFKKPL
jgi:hypothetical protein